MSENSFIFPISKFSQSQNFPNLFHIFQISIFRNNQVTREKWEFPKKKKKISQLQHGYTRKLVGIERTRERRGEGGECGSSKAVFASSIRARVAHVRLSFVPGAGQRLRGRISVFPAAKGELAPPRNVSQARKYTAVNTHSVYRGYVKMRRSLALPSHESRSLFLHVWTGPPR